MSTFNSIINFSLKTSTEWIGQVDGSLKVCYRKELRWEEWNWEVDRNILLLPVHQGANMASYILQQVKESGETHLFLNCYGTESLSKAKAIGFSLWDGDEENGYWLFLQCE